MGSVLAHGELEHRQQMNMSAGVPTLAQICPDVLLVPAFPLPGCRTLPTLFQSLPHLLQFRIASVCAWLQTLQQQRPECSPHPSSPLAWLQATPHSTPAVAASSSLWN